MTTVANIADHQGYFGGKKSGCGKSDWWEPCNNVYFSVICVKFKITAHWWT